MAKMAKWRRHTVEFKREVVERMKTCQNIHELARELKLQRKLLYTCGAMTGSSHPRRVRKEVARSRKLPITGKRSARPAGKPGDFLIAKERLQRSLPRHFLLSASNHTERSVCVFKAWRNLSVRCGQNKNQILGRDRPPPDGRPRGPGKRTRREDHALLIVRDEFRTGYSRSEEHTSELQSRQYLVCRLLLEKKTKTNTVRDTRTDRDPKAHTHQRSHHT